VNRLLFLTDQNTFWGRWLPRLFVLFWVIFAYDKADVLPKLDQRPVGEHLWAQLDRGSAALSYYMDDAPFLLPRCHQTSFDDEGITAGEFPLIPFTVSKIYSAFGFHEKYHRILVLILTLLAIPFAYGIMLQLLGSAWWAATATSLWFASPNLVFYSISFLPDGPAMTFSLAAIYFLLRIQEGSAWNTVAYGGFLALAGLLKLTAVAVVLPIVAVYVVKDFKWKSVLAKLRAAAIPTVVALALIGSWVMYARWLNDQHHTFTFLLSALPPKDMTHLKDGLDTLLLLKEWYYVSGFWWFLMLAAALTIVFVRRADRFLGLATLALTSSFAAVFLILFEKSPTHMYYWVPFQILVLFCLGWIISTFSRSNPPVWLSIFVFAGLVVLINYDSIHIHRNVKARWTHSPAIYAEYYDLEQKLNELGVGYDARVFSYEDESFNNSLYFMNRKGSVAHRNMDPERIERWINRCTHAVLNDTALVAQPEFKHYFYKRLGTHGNLYIYELHADQRADS